jgi:hypothetical protein
MESEGERGPEEGQLEKDLGQVNLLSRKESPSRTSVALQKEIKKLGHLSFSHHFLHLLQNSTSPSTDFVFLFFFDKIRSYQALS